MAWEEGPFRLPCIRDVIPEKVKPWFFVLVAITLQTSNVVYLSSSGNVLGTYGDLRREDLQMCLYAAFAGMNIAFPMMWKFKFTFTTQQVLTIAFSTLIISNIVTAYVPFVPVLLFFSFIGGFAKIWGTFESISTINPWLAPHLNFPRFFPLLYMLILGPIYLTIIFDINLTYYTSDWRSMHYFVIGLLLVLLLFVRLFFVPFYPMGKKGWMGRDFLGFLLWALLMMQMSFVAIYGTYYDWFNSPEIRLAMGTILITAAILFFRMHNMDDPYISWKAITYRRVPYSLFLFFVTDAMLEAPNTLQNIMTSQLLHLDGFQTNILNYWALAGTLCGCLFSLLWMTKLHYRTLKLSFFGFGCAITYHLIMYFLVSTTTELSDLILPTFVRTLGYACIYCSLTYYLKKHIPFDKFLQTLALVGVVRSGLGGSIGDAIYEHFIEMNISKNTAMLSTFNSGLWSLGSGLSADTYSYVLFQQVLAVSIKEIWGWVLLLSIGTILVLLVMGTPAEIVSQHHPRKTQTE